MRALIQALRRALCPAVLLSIALPAAAQNQPDAGMLRYPDVSDEHIVFVYGNDLWLAPKDGGEASPVASPPGSELFPKFSPDGASVVFQGNYRGDRDLYTLPIAGGVPERITHAPMNEMPTDWHEARGVVFHARGMHGIGRAQNIFTVPAGGGMFTKLPMPYGANGALSPDGDWIAYTPIERDFRTWKKYRGGMASDIWLFNLETSESRRITDWEGTDTLPMWHDETVYYLSDAGDEERLNIWAYDVERDRRRQITEFAEFDVKFPSIGPGDRGRGEIVFQNGPSLYLLDLRRGESREVSITIPGAKPEVGPQMVDASETVLAAGISATGKRAVMSARGDIWTAPAETGSKLQLTDTDGAAERSPSWSPDGRWVAYFSDEDGEYNLYITQSDGQGETRQLTDVSENFFFAAHWSPDSEHIAITDKAGAIHLVRVEDGETSRIAKDPWSWVPNVDWSPDSRWIAYDAGDEQNMLRAVWLYDTESGERTRVTSAFYNDSEPVFSREGDFLYYASQRDFSSPTYQDAGSGLGRSFVYDETERLIAVPLNAEVENPRVIENDMESWETDDDAGEDDANGNDENGGEDKAGGDGDDAGETPLQGTWTATALGVMQLGLPEDVLEFTMYFAVLDDGSIVGASAVMGETNDYDVVEFDPDTSLFRAVSSAGGPRTELVGKLEDGELKGSWTLTGGGMEGEGTWSATRESEDVPAGKIEAMPEGENGDDDEEAEPVEIDLENFEARGMEMPVEAGSYSNLVSNNKGHLIFQAGGDIKIIDFTADEPKVKVVASGARMIDISGDGEKLLLAAGDAYAIVDAAAGQSLDEPMDVSGMHTLIDPREEWRNLVRDAWRRLRDFFYVENMHGVDWQAQYERYSAMIDDAADREDVGFIIGEMIAELNVGHAYYRSGGTGEDEPRVNVGLLGVDFELASQEAGNGEPVRGYRIARIYHGEPWDTTARNPLMAQRMDVEEGDFITHVNGRPIDTSVDPYAAFTAAAGEDTTITFADALVGTDEERNERSYTIEPLGSERELRYRDWIRTNRAYVAEASDERIGYIHVPNTGVGGQNELFRQFYGQKAKDALIIDERWNGGGQAPNRFIELLNRPRTNYWKIRDGKDWAWPPDSHQGPKAMLINGAAGSGGDMFPWLFRFHEVGALIGTRTWGGLVGISGMPPLIDGASVTAPDIGFYETDGTWGVEGHGVDPDIEVIADPSKMARGADPQIDAAIEHLLEKIRTDGYERPEPPEPPVRTGIGIAPEDK